MQKMSLCKYISTNYDLTGVINALTIIMLKYNFNWFIIVGLQFKYDKKPCKTAVHILCVDKHAYLNSFLAKLT